MDLQLVTTSKCETLILTQNSPANPQSLAHKVLAHEKLLLYMPSYVFEAITCILQLRIMPLSLY